MSETQKYSRCWLGGKIMLSTYIIVAAIIATVGALLLAYFIESENYRKHIDFNNPVEAQITKYDTIIMDAETDSFKYWLIYEYTSDQNIYYSGYWEWYKDETVAKSYVGKIIEIYINEAGESTPWVKYKDQKVWAIALSVALLTVAVTITVVLIIPHRWKPPKSIKMKGFKL